MRLCGLVDVGERRPGLDADDPLVGVSPDGSECAQVEDQAAVHRPVAGDTVTAPADGQRQPMLGPGPQSGRCR